MFTINHYQSLIYIWPKLTSNQMAISQSRPIFQNGEFRPQLTIGVWYSGYRFDAELGIFNDENKRGKHESTKPHNKFSNAQFN